MKPDPTNTPNAKQVDDNVQNSALGAVKPLAEHPGSGRLVPVSAATPDAEPKATRTQPPQKTGHDIGTYIQPEATPLMEGSSTTPAVPMVVDPNSAGDVYISKEEYEARNKAQGTYGKLPETPPPEKSHDEVVAENAAAVAKEDQKQVDDPASPLQAVPEVSDPPFPRATPGLPPLTPKSVSATTTSNSVKSDKK